MTTMNGAETAERWTGAVLKLISLTQSKKMEWKREENRTNNSSSFITRYSADLQGQRFVLSVDISTNRVGTMSGNYLSSLGMNPMSPEDFRPVSLKVFSASGREPVAFPAIPALEGLSAVVYSQASDKVEEVLSAIEAI